MLTFMSKSIIYQYFITKTNHRKQGLDFWDFLISQNMDHLNYQRFFWGKTAITTPKSIAKCKVPEHKKMFFQWFWVIKKVWTEIAPLTPVFESPCMVGLSQDFRSIFVPVVPSVSFWSFLPHLISDEDKQVKWNPFKLEIKTIQLFQS